jgi:uncharacterized membrane protein YeaQ/YmgE (transglycosylase-associated protein family)
MNIGKLIAWLIVGALAGTLAGRLVTLRKEGLGLWTNIGIGLVGAIIGGFFFNLFNFNLGLGEITFTLEDVIAAFAGSILFIVLWWLFHITRGNSQQDKPKE